MRIVLLRFPLPYKRNSFILCHSSQIENLINIQGQKKNCVYVAIGSHSNMQLKQTIGKKDIARGYIYKSKLKEDSQS